MLHIQDVTLSDGMHAKRGGYSPRRGGPDGAGTDTAGVAAIEVAPADSLSGSSLTYGFGRHADRLWIEAAAAAIETARLGTLLIPGIGTIDDLEEAAAAGVHSVRIATHCTEASLAAQYIGAARNLGLDVAGCLMMAHLNTPAGLAEQARLMETYGAQCVTIADSAGALTVTAAAERIAIVRHTLRPDTEVGIHAHNNLSLGVAISLAAVELGVSRVGASRRRRREHSDRGVRRRRRQNGAQAWLRPQRAHGCSRGTCAAAPESPGSRGSRDAVDRLCWRTSLLPAVSRNCGRSLQG